MVQRADTLARSPGEMNRKRGEMKCSGLEARSGAFAIISVDLSLAARRLFLRHTCRSADNSSGRYPGIGERQHGANQLNPDEPDTPGVGENTLFLIGFDRSREWESQI